jgi:molecular chaperone GrpE
MTEKKQHKHEEEAEQNEGEVVAESVNSGELLAEIVNLKQRLEESESKTNEYRDSWMRSQAEFQNYRKRLERDHELTYTTMKGDIVKKILPVLDDLERALQNRPVDSSWASGIQLIARKLQNTLENEGVKKIEAEGMEFDPNFHEAISHEPADGVKSGFVISVVQNGYMLGDRVLRPAMVRVAQ